MLIMPCQGMLARTGPRDLQQLAAPTALSNLNLLPGGPMIDFKEVRDQTSREEVLEVRLKGRLLLDCSLLNKGSAFTETERFELDLLGLLPPGVTTLEEQTDRRYLEFKEKTDDLERYLFLRSLQDRNETLFYTLLHRHIAEMLPIIYTPEVGEVCQRYSRVYHRPRGLFLSYPDLDKLDVMLANRPYREVDVIVVTDGERILGLGDQGVGGMGIPVGKLVLYTLCGGIHPGRTLPILLDVGTDNPELLADPHYLGWRHQRVRGKDYDAFVDAFVEAIERQLPGVLLQWEDFAQGNARRLLQRYRHRLCTFNDDIQGAAAVTLAALLSAVRISGSRLSDQRVVLIGAGSAGIGICDLIVAALHENSLSAESARSGLWLVDRQGLLHTSTSDVQEFQRPYCQAFERVTDWRANADGNISLLEVVRQVHPTVLIGVSGQPGLFTEEIIRTMVKHVERPIILPLSNPTSRSEGVPNDLIAWTEGRALIATGSPFPPCAHNGRTFPISQCNNSHVFPGMGLGVIASGAKRVTDDLFLTAASALSDCPKGGGMLLPPLEDTWNVSRHIALAVGSKAMEAGLAPKLNRETWEKVLDTRRWTPRYLKMRYSG